MISIYYVAMIIVIFVVIVFILNRTNMEIKAEKDYIKYQLQLVLDVYNKLAQESSDLVQDFERERAELEKEITNHPLYNKTYPCDKNCINGEIFKVERTLQRI